MDKQGLKMYEDKQEVFGLKKLLFIRIFLNGKSLCSKKLSGKGGTPPPLTEKIR